MNSKLLQNLTVMVTRPKPSGNLLCNQIEAAGGKAIFFPTIEIKSLTDSPNFLKAMTLLDELDWLIFVSPQAVYQVASLIQARKHLLSHIKVAAIGGGTAATLKEVNIPLHVVPNDQWNSEGLLALPAFHNIKNKKIALVRGEGGRTLLADELINRGAKLIHWIVYRRSIPITDIKIYLGLLQDSKIDIIVSTSNEGLQNLNTLLGQEAKLALYSVPLIVISDKMAQLAKQMNFRTILLAKNACHDAIMTTLKDQMHVK